MLVGTSFFFVFSQNFFKCTFLKLSITTYNNFFFTLVFDITYPSPNVLNHFPINIFGFFRTPKLKNIQDCVSEDSKALNSHCTKAFGEGYVISKTKVKQNFLVLVNDYFKKVHLEQFRKKRMLQEKM